MRRILAHSKDGIATLGVYAILGFILTGVPWLLGYLQSPGLRLAVLAMVLLGLVAFMVPWLREGMRNA